MPANTTEVEQRLWDAADELRANSRLKSSEYSVPVLGLIFLRYADARFTEAEKEIAAHAGGRRTPGKTDYRIVLEAAAAPPEFTDDMGQPVRNGEPVPDLKLTATDGTVYQLKELRGKFVFLEPC